ncbi:MAG: hypothetical protein ABJL17_08970 [Parvibaculum sp.]|uniref:hypothetical protein n=1 Tax=Parvibaculum sp. TaxID=2024848 RepID=UPI003267A44E
MPENKTAAGGADIHQFRAAGGGGGRARKGDFETSGSDFQDKIYSWASQEFDIDLWSRILADPPKPRPANQGGAMSDLSREELDAKLLATERRMEATEARIESTLKAIPNRYEFYALLLTVFLGVVAILAWGGDRFDGGVQVATGFAESTIETQQLAKQNAEQIQALTERSQKNDAQLDAIFERLVGSSGEKSE